MSDTERMDFLESCGSLGVIKRSDISVMLFLKDTTIPEEYSTLRAAVDAAQLAVQIATDRDWELYL